MTNLCCICNKGLPGNYSGLNVRSCRLAARSTSTRRRHAGLGARRSRCFTDPITVAHEPFTAACFLTLKRRERRAPLVISQACRTDRNAVACPA